MKFRRIVKTIDVEQYNGDVKLKGVCLCDKSTKPHLHTIHEGQYVDLALGDWIMPEPDEIHFYPIKNDIFKNTYEPI